MAVSWQEGGETGVARPKKLSKRVKEATTRGRAAIAALREAEEIDSLGMNSKKGLRRLTV